MVETILWWRDGVIYQIYPRFVCGSNQDGIGDLNGITGRLITWLCWAWMHLLSPDLPFSRRRFWLRRQ